MATFYEFAVSAFSNGLDVEAFSDELRYDFDFGANLNGVSADGSLLGAGKRCSSGRELSGGCARPFGIPEAAAPPVKAGLYAISDGMGIVVVVIRRPWASAVADAAVCGGAALYEVCCTAWFSG